MCALLLIEEYALTHSAGEAISPGGRVFRPKALQDRLVRSRLTTTNITVHISNINRPVASFAFQSPVG
jgi:hypothetical protein